EHLLYRGILLPFTKHADKAECVLGCVQSRRVQARQPAAPDIARAKLPLQLQNRPEQVRQVENPPSVTYPDPERVRAALSHARQQAAVRNVEETSRTKRARDVLSALRSSMRWAIRPSGVISSARSVPAIGKAILSQQHSDEFALLLAQRSDAAPGRFEIVSIVSPVLLNLAMRSAFARSRSKPRLDLKRRGER